MTKPFTFPFDTCEIPNKKNDIAQPYSLTVNIIIACVILYFLFHTKSIYSFLFILSLLVFEMMHSFSHMIHIPGNFQFKLIHSFALIIILSLLNLLYHYTKVLPNILTFIICGIVICLDFFFIIQKYSFIYNVFAYITLFLIILYSYYSYLSKYIHTQFHYLFLSILLFSFFAINETMNCNQMLKIFPGFPFHIFVEVSSFFPIYFICKSFYNL